MHQNVSFPHKKIKKFSEEGTQFFHRPFPWWERNTLFHTYFSSAPPLRPNPGYANVLLGVSYWWLTWTPSMFERCAALSQLRLSELVTNATGTRNLPLSSTSLLKPVTAAGIASVPRASTPSTSKQIPNVGFQTSTTHIHRVINPLLIFERFCPIWIKIKVVKTPS